MEIKLGHPYMIYLGSRVSNWEAKVKPAGERTVVPFRNGRKYVTIAFIHEADVMKIPVRERRKGQEDIYVADGIFQAARRIMPKRWAFLLRTMEMNADLVERINDDRIRDNKFLMKWPRSDYNLAISVMREFIDEK